MLFKCLLRLMKGPIHTTRAQVTQMKVNYPGAASGAACLQAHICTIKMEPSKSGGNAHQRIAANDQKVFVQAQNAGRKTAAPLIITMWVGDARDQRSTFCCTRIARQGPIRILSIKCCKAFLESSNIISQQANILMADNHISPSRKAQKSSNALKCIPIISVGIVEIQKLRTLWGEASGQEAFDHRNIIRVSSDQRADAEWRRRNGPADIHGLCWEVHSFKIVFPTALRKMTCFWSANEPARLR